MKNADPTDRELLLLGLSLVRVQIADVAQRGARLPSLSTQMQELRARVVALEVEVSTPGGYLILPAQPRNGEG